MTKSKTKTEVEHLRGVVKSLKSELRNIKKEMGRKQKREHLYEDLEDRQEEELEKAEQRSIRSAPITDNTHCPKCNSNIDIIDCGGRQVHLCQSCDYRVSKKT